MGSKMSQKERVDTNHLGSKYKTVDPSPVEKSLERLKLLFASRMYLITLVYITIEICCPNHALFVGRNYKLIIITLTRG